MKRNFIATNFYCAEQKSRISEKREKRNKEKRKENGYKGKIGKMKLSDNEPSDVYKEETITVPKHTRH